MKIIEYDRAAAVAYAKHWAYARNPAFYNYDRLGGDCTNYVSQCLFAGCGVMNDTPIFGWFYRSANDRTASWTGVEYLYRFLTENNGPGPFGHAAALEELEPGDLVQFGRETGDFYHTPIVCGRSRKGLLVAAHTFDAFNRPLSDYSFERIRGIRIDGAHKS